MPNTYELNSDERTQFINQMSDKYEADFMEKLHKANNAISESKAREYFQTFATALYDKEIPGLSQSYGHYSEEVRQQMVEAFYLQTSALIKSLGDVAAQGCTFLWSNQNIGMFAAADQAIREAAGVFAFGQSLEQTPLGNLWSELEVLKNPDKAMGLTWDKTSQAWNAISKEFAAQAEGDVHVFLPKDIGALTIFWNVELPELRKRMQPFMNPPKVRDITLHSLKDQTLINLKQIEQNQTLTEAQKKEEKRKLMTNQTNWENKKIKDASIEVPGMTQAQKEQIKQVLENSPNPRQLGLVEILNSRNTVVNSITLNKLHNISERWRINAKLKQLKRENQSRDKSKVIQNIIGKMNKNSNRFLPYFRRPSSRPHQNSSRPPR